MIDRFEALQFTKRELESWIFPFPDPKRCGLRMSASLLPKPLFEMRASRLIRDREGRLNMRLLLQPVTPPPRMAPWLPRFGW